MRKKSGRKVFPPLVMGLSATPLNYWDEEDLLPIVEDTLEEDSSEFPDEGAAHSKLENLPKAILCEDASFEEDAPHPEIMATAHNEQDHLADFHGDNFDLDLVSGQTLQDPIRHDSLIMGNGDTPSSLATSDMTMGTLILAWTSMNNIWRKGIFVWQPKIKKADSKAQQLVRTVPSTPSQHLNVAVPEKPMGSSSPLPSASHRAPLVSHDNSQETSCAETLPLMEDRSRDAIKLRP
ncbi:hypothetical protein Dimus_018643 [Dionaea muscipula]